MNARELDLVQRVRRGFTLAKRRLAVMRRQARVDTERRRAEVELICDDLLQQGIDPKSQLGRECLVRVIADRFGGRGANEAQWSDDDGFPLDNGEW